MTKPFLVFEDLDRGSRHELFHLLGTRWVATGFARLHPVFWCALGISVSFLTHGSASLGHRLASGLAYGLMLMIANAIHSIGHIVAGRIVGEPMASIVLTATRDVAIYVRKGTDAPRVRRVLRSLGGPAVNLGTGVLALVTGRAADVEWLRMFGLLNLLIGAWTLLPVPSLDGAVIWSSLLRRNQR